jgi:hypothetical protein
MCENRQEAQRGTDATDDLRIRHSLFTEIYALQKVVWLEQHFLTNREIHCLIVSQNISTSNRRKCRND